jgi:circadian clock protein KaiC
VDRRTHEAERKRKVLEAKIEGLRSEFDMESEELQIISADEKKRYKVGIANRSEMARLRKADRSTDSRKKGRKRT